MNPPMKVHERIHTREALTLHLFTPEAVCIVALLDPRVPRVHFLARLRLGLRARLVVTAEVHSLPSAGVLVALEGTAVTRDGRRDRQETPHLVARGGVGADDWGGREWRCSAA